MFIEFDGWGSSGKLRLVWLSLLIVAFGGPGWAQAQETSLSLAEAERLAVAYEPGFTAQLERAQAYREQAVADRQLPDPALVVGALNVPTNDFSLKTEPMTQLRIGLRQMFPRGDSRRIRQDIALATADEMVSNAAARHLWVKREVRFAWFDAAYWEAAGKIVEADKPLFVQLRDVTASFYEVGRKDLQDVVRSELELQRLEDRLMLIRERHDRCAHRHFRAGRPIVMTATTVIAGLIPVMIGGGAGRLPGNAANRSTHGRWDVDHNVALPACVTDNIWTGPELSGATPSAGTVNGYPTTSQ